MYVQYSTRCITIFIYWYYLHKSTELILKYTFSYIAILQAKPSSNLNIPIEYLKSALLKTPGPICTYSSFTQSGPQNLRTISKQDFLQAVLSLESNNLIDIVNMSSPSGELRPVLVKKQPQAVQHILMDNPALCSMDVYTKRFNFPVPVKVINSIRKKLVELGYVTQQQVEYVNKKNK